LPSSAWIVQLERRRSRRERWVKHPARQNRGFLFAIGAALLVALAVGMIFAAFSYTSITTSLPSLDQLPLLLDPQNGSLLQPTRLYDRSGEILLTTLEYPGATRTYLSIDPALEPHVSPQLIQATLALLQPDFWQSPGADWNHLTDPQPYTLAERLVLDLLLWQEPASTQRAVRMRLLASQIIERYGRGQVLEWYLNSAWYGDLAFGAESAARLYLGKPAQDLSLAESAFLAALAESPSITPLDAPQVGADLQADALNRMLLAGTISAEDYEQARLTTIIFSERPVQADSLAPAFTQLVVEQLSGQFGQQRLGRGGLVIRTSLDYDLQQQLYCALLTQLARMEAQQAPSTLADGNSCSAARLLSTQSLEYFYPADLTASAAVTDPLTGEVLALIGETTMQGETSLFNGHTPGSILTPFVAVAAFSHGYSPSSLLWDIPTSIPLLLTDRQDPDGVYHGPVRLRTALANDYLAPLAGLLEQMGADSTWQLAVPFGLASLEYAADPLDLLFDGGSATPLEIARGYGVFANLGQLAGRTGSTSASAPVMAVSVQDTAGYEWLDEGYASTQVVISPAMAYLVHDMLTDEVARWPSLGNPNPLELDRTAGGKTGQTANGQNAWAVGYLPQLVASVWIGLPSSFGSELTIDPRSAAAVTHAVLLYASQDLPDTGWQMPDGVTAVEVCDPSGLLPTEICPNRVSEVFLSGSEPISYDNLYQAVDVNRETGLLATVYTPLDLVEERVYLNVPEEARPWALSAGLSLPPATYDTIMVPSPIADAHITAPENFSFVRGIVDINGTAAGDDLVSFRLQVGRGIYPDSWLALGADQTDPVNEGLLGQWDTTSLSDGLYAVQLLVQRSGQGFDLATIQLSVDNTPPTVEVVYPVADTIISAGTQVVLQAGPQDSTGIQRLEWWMDGVMIGTRSALPYSLPWQAEPGQHTLIVRAYDLAGNSADSQEIQFTVAE
jgi:membrane peptidoglycan carboxypeptidase